jgi:hypothetical protein
VKAVFADSFYFLALLRWEDSAHARAIVASQNRTERLITTAWILTERRSTPWGIELILK